MASLLLCLEETDHTQPLTRPTEHPLAIPTPDHDNTRHVVTERHGRLLRREVERGEGGYETASPSVLGRYSLSLSLPASPLFPLLRHVHQRLIRCLFVCLVFSARQGLVFCHFSFIFRFNDLQ